MDDIAYLNLDLCIDRVGEAYRARTVESPAGKSTATFSQPFSDLELENFALRMGGFRRRARRWESPEMGAAKDLGGRLFASVFVSDVLACLRGSVQEAKRRGVGLRIRLNLADAPELADLPWEYLYDLHQNQFLALSKWTPLVRFLDVPGGEEPLAINPPLRVLAMIASPTDYGPLDVDREWGNIEAALEPLVRRGVMALDRLEEASLGALQRRLRAPKQQGACHVFHFIGHGGFDKQAQDGVLVLEDREKRGRLVSGQELGTLLGDRRELRLAVLNACEGARSSRTEPFAGTAQSLIQQGTPAVIGMQFEISDEAAITFAREFYGALADGYPIDICLAEARKAIYAQGNDVEWGTPVLHTSSPAGRIFEIVAPDPPTESEQQTREREEEGRQALLADVYARALAHLREGQWEQAIPLLKEIVARQADYAEASVNLEEAVRQQRLADLYAQARRAEAGQSWDETIRSLEAIIGIDPHYRDAAARLGEARRRQRPAAFAPPLPSRGGQPSSAYGAEEAGAAGRGRGWLWLVGGAGAVAVVALFVVLLVIVAQSKGVQSKDAPADTPGPVAEVPTTATRPTSAPAPTSVPDAQSESAPEPSAAAVSAPSPTLPPTPSPSSPPPPVPPGDYREVQNTQQEKCLRGRAEPSTGAPIWNCAAEGFVVRVVNGPRVADGYEWFNAEGIGWMAGRRLSDGLVMLQSVPTPPAPAQMFDCLSVTLVDAAPADFAAPDRLGGSVRFQGAAFEAQDDSFAGWLFGSALYLKYRVQVGDQLGSGTIVGTVINGRVQGTFTAAAFGPGIGAVGSVSGTAGSGC